MQKVEYCLIRGVIEFPSVTDHDCSDATSIIMLYAPVKVDRETLW